MVGDGTAERVIATAAATPALSCVNATKRYGTVTVLDQFDLEILPGEIHALVGENGSGKSTFIKALSGYHSLEPGGTIAIAGRRLDRASAEEVYELGARFVQQDLGLVESLSVLDNFLLSSGFPTRLWTVRTRRAIRAVRAQLSRVGLDIDPRRPVASLSPAQKTEVAIARALQADPHSPAVLLVMDEPTATLASDAVDRLLQTLRRVAAGGCAILYVSHRLEEVLAVADRVTVLRDGKKIETRSTKGLRHTDLVTVLVGRDLREAESHLRDSTRQRATKQDLGVPALGVEGLTAGPLKKFSFEVQAGDILGIAGITGSGREAVLPAIFAGTDMTEGTVTVKHRTYSRLQPRSSVRAGIAYLPPDRKRLSGLLTLTARENLTIASLRSMKWGFTLRRRREVAETRKWFAALEVRPASGIEKRLSEFSGGNQQKVLLAKWLRCGPAVFLLDEPTQGVDVGAKSEIYKHIVAAASGGAAVVITSSDVQELEALCNRVIVLRNGNGRELPAEDLSASEISRECVRAS
jgi:ribose transport system ATP-binding protein